jgi:hypothetical protein
MNERTVVNEFMQITACSEAHARSVYMHLEALSLDTLPDGLAGIGATEPEEACPEVAVLPGAA